MSVETLTKRIPYPQLLPIFVFAAMLIASWHRWTGLIVDIGRESDLPRRLLEGEVLYRDIHYTYTPFSPYFNSFLYFVFGARLDTLTYSGILLTALASFLCYRIARRLMPPLESSIAVSIVILLCFFKPGGNTILPYSFGSLHGTIFSLGCVLFLLRFTASGLRRELVFAGLFAGFALLSKQEFGVATAFTIAVFLLYLHRLRYRAFFVDLTIAGAAALAVALPVFAWLFATIDWNTLVNDCHLFYTNIPESLVGYNRWRSGLDDPLGSLLQMFGAAAVGGLIASAIVLISGGKLVRKNAVAVLISCAFVAGLFLYIYADSWDGSPIRAVPFLLGAILIKIWFSRRGVNSGPEADGRDYSTPALFLISLFGLGVLFRVMLRVPSGGFSGASFLPVPLIVICFSILSILPDALKRWTGDEGPRLRARNLARAFLILVLLVLFFGFGLKYQRRFSFPIKAENGSVYVEPNAGKPYGQAVRFIESNTRKNEVIAVLPEGNDLAFLTGRRIDLRHQVLIPAFLSRQDELDAISAMERDDVRFIFVVNRPMKEFGKTAFGRDFYMLLGGWIEDNYEVADVFGIEKGEKAVIGESPFFIKAYKRKEK